MRGRSMEPTLREGDLLLALWGAVVRDGDVAVVRLPRDAHGAARPVSVKRILGRDPDDPLRWWLDSDNAREGVTSFDVGSVPGEDVLAVVVGRIAPRPGRMRARPTP
ncbi:signal peptidase [Knoellia aerolata DSM 18566]|uniref:Signal peptidase n=1 Tax=Knoellia aerolata DSM 18566 TaxID=1385519 RepID=A0A0A0JX80_9MICO|nr:signal peptidase [Knoellia aerolata DSM 18566]